MSAPHNPSRIRLDALVHQFALELPDGSRVLDAGSAQAPYRHHFTHCKYETCDLQGSVTYKSDLTNITVPDNLFDSIVCTQVLEHVKDPVKVLKELNRVLKPGGKLFVSAPFFYEEHLIPNDYLRFTEFGFRYILLESDFEINHHEWLEGFSCAIFYFLSYASRELTDYFHSNNCNDVKESLNKLAAHFLDQELNAPLIDCGFPKNHVFICKKKDAFSENSAFIRSLIDGKLTYLNNAAFFSLSSAIDCIQQRKIPGDYCDFGIALGGSSIFIASRLSPETCFFGFDVFERIPPPGLKDDKASHERYATIASGLSTGIKGDVYYGYLDNLFDIVCGNFENYGLHVDGNTINLIKGQYEKVLTNTAQPSCIAFAHIDCDWYESVKIVLEFLKSRMSIGSYIVVDDFNAWGGAR